MSLLLVLVLARCILLTLLARVSSVLVLLLLGMCLRLDRHVLLLSWRFSDLLGSILLCVGSVREEHLGDLLDLASAAC